MSPAPSPCAIANAEAARVLFTSLIRGSGTTNDLTLDFEHNPAMQIVRNERDNNAYSFVQANANVTDTVNGLNQVTATGGTGVTHDARGNVSAIGGSGYTYTGENLLLTGPGSVAFGYDPLLRLYYAADAPQVVAFGYDGASLTGEYDGTGTALRRYVHGPGVDEPLVWYEGSGTSTRRYFHADERGSVIAVSDSSGNLVGSTPNRYDEYGAPQGGAITGRFGYTGQMWLPEIQMYHARNRTYNPTGIGDRFMQTDPSGFTGGLHLYRYPSDPVNLTDPLGLFPSRIFYKRDDKGYSGYVGLNNGGISDSGLGGSFGGTGGSGGGKPGGSGGGGTQGGGGGGPMGHEGVHTSSFDDGGGGGSVSFGHGSVGIGGTNDCDSSNPANCHITVMGGPLSSRNVQGGLLHQVTYEGPAPNPRDSRNPRDYCGSDEADLPEGVWANACRRHDECYAAGRPKGSCDARFFWNILADCSDAIFVPAACLLPAIIGVIIVDLGGDDAYRRSNPNRRR